MHSHNLSVHDLWLIGAGPMAQEYAHVLTALRREFIVIARGDNSAQKFESVFGVNVVRGGLRLALNISPAPNYAIVSVSIDQLKNVTLDLLESGCKNILLEKPGGLDEEEIGVISKAAVFADANIFIGYNRRFFDSIIKAESIIKEDGGVTSARFQFTEFGSKIALLKHPKQVKERWALSNSSHVFDAFVLLCGRPKKINIEVSGRLDWHPAGSIFCGSGITENSVLFSYHANWSSGGSWGIELFTQKRCLILKPMEKLFALSTNSFYPAEVDLGHPRQGLKYGLLKQVDAFLKKDFSRMCSVEEQEKNMRIYSKMAGYR